MTSLLDGLIDPRLITWLIIGVIALIVVYTAYRIVRMLTAGTYIAGGRNRRTRLAVLDAAAVDERRRLVLVRRDDVEHLILIGGPTDVVVEQNIRIGARSSADQEVRAAARPTRPVVSDPEEALDSYDHGDQALQPHPLPPAPPRQPRQPERTAERKQPQRAPSRPIHAEPAPSRPIHVEPTPSRQAYAEPAPFRQEQLEPPTPEPQPVAVAQMIPVAPMPARQKALAPMTPQAQSAAAPHRPNRPVMPRVTLPAATQPSFAKSNFVQAPEEHRDPPMTAQVTPHPSRAQATRRAQQLSRPQSAPIEHDLDDALLQELETSLRYPARERPRTKAADIDDEMNKLLGEMSRDRR